MCVCFGVHASVHLAHHTFLISRASGFSTRNKLGAETVHKTGVLKMDIWRRQIKEGCVPICKKQQFSTVDQPNCVTTPVSIDPGVSLINFVQFLINKANDDNNTNLPTGKDGLD